MRGDQQKNARAKYIFIGSVRVMGVMLMAIGFAIILNGFMQLPELAGYFLVFMGGFEFIAMPIILARAWKTPEEDKSENRSNAGIEKE